MGVYSTWAQGTQKRSVQKISRWTSSGTRCGPDSPGCCSSAGLDRRPGSLLELPCWLPLSWGPCHWNFYQPVHGGHGLLLASDAAALGFLGPCLQGLQHVRGWHAPATLSILGWWGLKAWGWVFFVFVFVLFFWREPTMKCLLTLFQRELSVTNSWGFMVHKNPWPKRKKKITTLQPSDSQP